MAIRGTRLQGGSVVHGLDDRSRDVPAAGRDVDYLCPAGHAFAVTFAERAEPPAEWDCRCGRTAARPGEAAAPSDLVPARHRDSGWTRSGRAASLSSMPPRTPWIMLTERRTREELEALLEERLALRRAARRGLSGAPARPDGEASS